MINPFKRNKGNSVSYVKFVWTTLLFCLTAFPLASHAQYYFMPRPISENKETVLLARLKNSKPDTQRVRILLDLSNLYYNLPIHHHHYLDIALSYATKAKLLSAQIRDIPGWYKAQVRTAEILGDAGKLEEAERILSQLNDSAKVELSIALSYRSCLMAADITDKYYKQAILLAKDAIAISIRLKNKEKELTARTLYVYLLSYNNYPRAEEAYQEIIKGYKAIHYPYLQYAYLSMFSYYQGRGFFDKCLLTAQDAIESIATSRDFSALGDTYLAFAIVYRNTGQHQKSIDYYKLAIRQLKIHPSGFGYKIPDVIIAISNTFRYMKKHQEALDYIKSSMKEYPGEDYAEKARYEQEIGRCYQELNDNTLAEEHLLHSYNYLYKSNQVDFHDNRRMAQFYVETKSYAKARPYLERILSGHKGYIATEFMAHIEYMAYMVDSAAGDYKAAMAHLIKNKKLDDSYLTEKRDREIQELNIKYETAKKEKAIISLNQQKKAAQDKLQRANLFRNASIVGVALVLLIAGMLYRQAAFKKRNNKIITAKNELLQKLVQEKEWLLQEKEWLLKEVHHRVKNNLHTVICLLESQAVHLENDALKAIENSQRRIYAMSLIHQKLYQSEDIKTIDMAVYLSEFIGYLNESFGAQESIQICCDIENLKLGVAEAIPIGLIVNEAVTNAFKYAFPFQSAGEITVALKKKGDEIRLTIEDNGVGMLIDPDDEEPGSLGLTLMKGLTQEINGKISFFRDQGTKVVITFNTDPFDVVSPVPDDVQNA